MQAYCLFKKMNSTQCNATYDVLWPSLRKDTFWIAYIITWSMQSLITIQYNVGNNLFASTSLLWRRKERKRAVVTVIVERCSGGGGGSGWEEVRKKRSFSSSSSSMTALHTWCCFLFNAVVVTHSSTITHTYTKQHNRLKDI